MIVGECLETKNSEVSAGPLLAILTIEVVNIIMMIKAVNTTPKV